MSSTLGGSLTVALGRCVGRVMLDDVINYDLHHVLEI